ncbi:hypothetical protein C7G97_01650 [Acinetobacter nosocomialis]|nr:hypothetical protein C7G97_01650 [Acinetobacter nosocomialis]
MVDDFKSAQKIKVLLWHGGLLIREFGAIVSVSHFDYSKLTRFDQLCVRLENKKLFTCGNEEL